MPNDFVSALNDTSWLEGDAPPSRPTKEKAPGAKAPREAGGGGTQSSASPSSSRKPKSLGVVDSFIRGASDTALFGFADEAVGVLNTFAPLDPGAKGFWQSNKSLSETIAANTANDRRWTKAASEEHSVAHIIGQVAGGLLIPFGAGAKTVGQFAKVGGVQGAIYGAGSGEGVADRAKKTVTYGASGALLGAALGKVTSFFRKDTSKVAKEVSEELAEEARGRVAGRISDGTVLGHTKSGVPIYGSKAVNAADEEVEPLMNALVPRAAAVEGEGVEAGTGVARAAKGAEEASQAGLGQRESLAYLQEFVEDMTKRQKTEGDRVVDVTWESAPDVAARTGEWRIGAFEKPEDAKSLLSALVRAVPSKTRMSDQELADRALEWAARIGEEGDDFLDAAKIAVGDIGDLPSFAMGYQTVWARASQDVTDLYLMNVDWATASDELVEEAAQRIYNLSSHTAYMQELKTALGRALRVRQLPTADAYRKRITQQVAEGAEDAAEDMANLPTTREGLGDWLDLWGLTAGNPREQNAFLRGTLTLPGKWNYIRQSAANYFTGNILSMPKTLGLNVVGPTVLSINRQIARRIGATVSSVALRSPEQRAAHRAITQHMTEAYWGTLAHAADSFKFALAAFDKNHTVLGGGGSTFNAQATYGPVTEQMLRAVGQENMGIVGKSAYTFGNALNFLPRGVARINNGADEMAKRMEYLSEVRIRAFLDGATTQGLEGEALARYVREAVLNSTDEAGAALNAEALREAERVTLTNKVGEKGTLLRGFANQMQKFRSVVPELRYIIPIFNVPMNGLVETLRHTPLAIASKGVRAELRGDRGALAQADAAGRMLLGSMYMAAGVMMARTGVLTGSGPEDAQDRKVWLQTHQPYSIKIGDQWVSYRKYDVIGSLLSVPASVADVTVYAKEEQTEQLIYSGIGALSQFFRDRSALQSAFDLLGAGQNPITSLDNVLPRIRGNIAGGFVPLSGAMGGLASATNRPHIDLKTSWTDYMEANIPLLGSQREVVRNVLGEPVDKPLNSLAEVIFPVVLVQASGENTDGVLDNLDELYQETGYGMGASSSSFSYGHFDDKEVQLEDGRSLYTHSMQLRQLLEIDGKTLRQTLQDLFASQAYKNAVFADSGQKLTSKGELSRGWMVAQVFKDYNAAIKGHLASTSPLAREYMAAATAKATDDAYLRGIPAEDLVENPDLWRARGIDKNTYLDKVSSAGSSIDLARAFGE